MTDWVTISSLATAGGTLVLAVATFSSVRSANRSARVAELSLLTGMRPVLIPSREDDPPERVRFGDSHVLNVPGHGASIEVAGDDVYMALGLRNGGAGLAVLHGWRAKVYEQSQVIARPDVDDFRRQQLDLYIPAGDTGYWQGRVRDPEDPDHPRLLAAVQNEERVIVDILYGDHEGGQRTIARFSMVSDEDVEPRRAGVLRYWNVDRDDPRERDERS